MNHSRTAGSSKTEQRSVVDIKRIVDALEGAGCEVREIKLVEPGYLAVVLNRTCLKSVRS